MSCTRYVAHPIASVVVVLLAALALPASAGIITLGDVSPDPTGGVVGVLGIGNAGAGSVAVDGGSSLTAEKLTMGGGPNGTGSLSVSGAGSSTLVTFLNGGNIDVGSQGTGSLSVLAGGSFTYGGGGTPCQTNCRVFVSNGAGATGSLLVNGAGSNFSTVGALIVGNASMFTLAADGGAFGAPGGAANGSAKVEAGGTVNSSSLTVAQPGGGLARTGTESSSGSVIIDGATSVWNLVRNAAQTGAQALLRVATGQNTSGSVEVRNGATLRLNGSLEADEFSGINVASITAGTTSSNANGSVTVNGPGSRIEVNGGVGFFNVGRGNGMTGALTVSNGGFIGGDGVETGLVYMTVGNGGGTGTANVTGAGSLLRLNGRNSTSNSDLTSVSGGGAFLSVGRGGGGSTGHGTMNITAGGSVVIDTSALALTNVDGQTGMYVGAFTGSTGTMNVSGPGSSLLITAGSGMAPYIGIGRDSGTGTLNISGGGRVEVSATHVSVPNLGTTTYLPGDVLLFDIGRRVDANGLATSAGTVTVSGAGSQLALTGNVDSLLVVGRGLNAIGTLNITSGGEVHSKSMLVGQEEGSLGIVNVNAGKIVLDGVLNGGPSAGLGVGMGVGRGGTGVMNIGNGSVVTISSTAPRASLAAAGSSTTPGGTGTINVSGASVVTVNGPEAVVSIGRFSTPTTAGIGTLNISGAGSSVSAVGVDARVLIGGGSNTIGAVHVGAGASLSATSLIGVAYDSNGSVAGLGSLIVNGTATATNLIIGANGLLGGSGVINANVTNMGVISPGESPGTLTINGAFDSSQGKIILEVLALGNGQFDVDKIVFGDPSNVIIGNAAIEFHFLGGTNPEDFLYAGLFELATFFKEADGMGGVADLDVAHLDWFNDAGFTAAADSFTISAFRFDPVNGASLTINAVPLPPTLMMVLLALGLMVRSTRRTKSA